MDQQFEQLVLPLNTRYGSAHRTILTDPFEEDLNIGVSEFHSMESDTALSPRQSFMRRVANRAVEASYSAQARFTLLTTKQKRVMGLVTVAGMAAGFGIGALDHGSVAQAQGLHFVDASYHPANLHPMVASHMATQSHDAIKITAAPESKSVHSAITTHEPTLTGSSVTPDHAHQAIKITAAPESKSVHSAITTHQPANATHEPTLTGSSVTPDHAHHLANHTHHPKSLEHHHNGRHHKLNRHEHHKHHHAVPTPGNPYTMKSGDNPWTIAQRALHIPFNGHNTQHQLHQIWLYDQHILHLNNITTEQAKYLQIGRKLLLPKV